MKIAEDFFYRIYPKTIGIDKDSPIFPFSINEITDLMEQFRKEGMEEAYNYMANISDLEIKSGDYLEFEEWYNQNKEV